MCIGYEVFHENELSGLLKNCSNQHGNAQLIDNNNDM